MSKFQSWTADKKPSDGVSIEWRVGEIRIFIDKELQVM